jgi:hypothetical protein
VWALLWPLGYFGINTYLTIALEHKLDAKYPLTRGLSVSTGEGEDAQKPRTKK